MPKIKIQDYKEMEVKAGSEFTEVYDQNPDLPLKFGCRRGQCGVCAIEVLEGCKHLTKKSEEECDTLQRKGLMGEQYRLSCQCAINGTIKIKKI